MYLNYYASNPFPAAQTPAAGPYGSFPLAPRGACGCPHVIAGHNAAALRAAHTLHPHRVPGHKPQMGFYRPNQAIQRSVYGQQWLLAGLGQNGIDLSSVPSWAWLAGGAAALLLVFGGHRVGRKLGAARTKRRRTKAARLRAQAAALEL
jgi:hypothetical protein